LGRNLYIFQGEMPGPLEAEQQQAAADAGPPPLRSTFQLNEVASTRQTKGGMVQIADSSNFKASKTIAASRVTIHPGGMRELHWHPNANGWPYVTSGKGRLRRSAPVPMR
jgi:oxalate decarboxylase